MVRGWGAEEDAGVSNGSSLGRFGVRTRGTIDAVGKQIPIPDSRRWMMKSLLESVAVLLVGFLVAFPFSVAAQETCCPRTIVVPPIPMPEGESYDYGSLLAGDILEKVLVPPTEALCPEVDFLHYEGFILIDRILGKTAGAKPDAALEDLKELMHGVISDYIFLGTVEAQNAVVEDGSIYGQFTLEMGLFQNCPSHFEQVQQ